MKKRWGEMGGYALHVATFVTYFVLLATREVPESWRWLQWPGMAFFLLGSIFLIASLISQQKNRGAALMETGAYGIVRHPMYLGAMLLFCAMFCFMPTWLMSMLAFINIAVIERFVEREEGENSAKFGADYLSYMKRVPKFNLMAGWVRWFKRRGRKAGD